MFGEDTADQHTEQTTEGPKQKEPQQKEPPRIEPTPSTAYPLVRRMGKGVPAPVAFLVDELIHEVGTGILASKYYGGKTYVAMGLAASVATGNAFIGRSVFRRGAVLWLAAEGEWEVDKRIRAAVTALGSDPDAQPIYVQIASVPKLLSNNGEAAVMAIVRQAKLMAREEFDVPLALIIVDTMIKAAGYKKSENDAVEVNNMIQAMVNISIRTKCFVLALDHMGKNEELGARGSSDKPSSVDVYIELKTNGGRTFHVVKVKGEKGDDQVDFEIVGTKLDDGQKTAFVRWGKWKEPEVGGKPLNGNARVLLECIKALVVKKGKQRIIIYGEPERRCVQKKDIYSEFCKKHKGGPRHDMAFGRSWEELVKKDLVAWVGDEESAADLDRWVFLDKEQM